MSNENDLLDHLIQDRASNEKSTTVVVEQRAYFNDNSIFYKGMFGMILCIMPVAMLGLVLVKMSLDQAKEARKSFKAEPHAYLAASVKKVLLGRKMAYIGLVMFVLEIVTLVIYMSVIS